MLFLFLQQTNRFQIAINFYQILDDYNLLQVKIRRNQLHEFHLDIHFIQVFSKRKLTISSTQRLQNLSERMALHQQF